jgi:hypothetical protein
MRDYKPPEIIASYSAADLVSDAGVSLAYVSDEALKDELTAIDKRLGGLKDVGTGS